MATTWHVVLQMTNTASGVSSQVKATDYQKPTTKGISELEALYSSKQSDVVAQVVNIFTTEDA